MENEGIINEDGSINFSLLNEQKGEFAFYIKAEANGGEILWTEDALTFSSECGPESAKI